MLRDRRPTCLTRRAFVGTTLMSMGARSAPPIILAQQDRGKCKGKGKKDPVRYPLYIPPILDAGEVQTLLAAPHVVDLGGENFSEVLAYNLGFPGPTFVANFGDVASIEFTNGLNEPTTVHWHGMIVPHAVDGHPKDAVPPGDTFNYDFLIRQRACLNWYHPHPHGRTAPQVNLGLAGAFIVRDLEEAALDLPEGPYEVPLVIRDANLDQRGNLRYKPKHSGFMGKTPLVNGTLNAKLDVDTELYRFRVLCGSNARVFQLALSNGAPLTIIGNDGGLLEFAEDVPVIEIGPGERLDLLVDFRGLNMGDKLTLLDLNSGWDMLEFEVTNVEIPIYSIPTGRLSTIDALPPWVRMREFRFEGMSRINGLEYEVDRIDFTVPFGDTELWRFSTGGNGPHPVHAHGMPFQVLSRTGGRDMVFPWEYGWKDTVLVQDGETVDVLVRFDAYDDQIYLMHCHQLEHEDNGMMMNFKVGPAPSP
jgi:blue copper oxidase